MSFKSAQESEGSFLCYFMPIWIESSKLDSEENDSIDELPELPFQKFKSTAEALKFKSSSEVLINKSGVSPSSRGKPHTLHKTASTPPLGEGWSKHSPIGREPDV